VLGGRTRHAALEKHRCDDGGRREASLAWALNDVFSDVFRIGAALMKVRLILSFFPFLFPIFDSRTRLAQLIRDMGQLMGPILVKIFFQNFDPCQHANTVAVND
jgi:hypothetical protein